MIQMDSLIADWPTYCKLAESPNDLINEWMNGQMNMWANEWKNEWTVEWINEWVNSWMNAWFIRWMNQWFVDRKETLMCGFIWEIYKWVNGGTNE